MTTILIRLMWVDFLNHHYLFMFYVVVLNTFYSSFAGPQHCSYRGPYSYPGRPGPSFGCCRLAPVRGKKEETDWRDIQTQCRGTVWCQLHGGTRCTKAAKGGKTHLNFRSLHSNKFPNGQLVSGSRVWRRSPAWPDWTISPDLSTSTEWLLQDALKKSTWLCRLDRFSEHFKVFVNISSAQMKQLQYFSNTNDFSLHFFQLCW